MSFHLSVIEEADALLIEKIRQTSILYNNHYVDFRHSHKKDKAWDEVASSLGISKSDAKKRWTCLRDRYSRELKDVRSKCPRKEDCGTGEFFQIMDFLRPFVRKRAPNKSKLARLAKLENDMKLEMNDIGNKNSLQSYEETQDEFDKTDNSEDYNYIACEYPIETYEEYTDVNETAPTEIAINASDLKNTKNNIIPMVFTNDPIATTTSTIESQKQSQTLLLPTQQTQKIELRTQQQETEDDFFCKSVAMYLRKLSRLHKIKAKVEMFQILEKYIEIEESSSSAFVVHQPNFDA